MQCPAAPAIAVQAILQALRTAPSCDVQEQHTSGVQPEQAEHELKRSQVTARCIRSISCKAWSLCGSTTIHAPAKKGSKGMNWQRDIPHSGLPTLARGE